MIYMINQYNLHKIINKFKKKNKPKLNNTKKQSKN